MPLLQFDLRDCPLPDNSVDAVLMLNVLEHIDHDGLAMHHVRRVLRPGGVAVIEVPAGPELYDVYDELLMHYRRYTARGLRSLIEGCGLEVVRFTHLGALLYPAFYVVKRSKSPLSLASGRLEARGGGERDSKDSRQPGPQCSPWNGASTW